MTRGLLHFFFTLHLAGVRIVDGCGEAKAGCKLVGLPPLSGPAQFAQSAEYDILPNMLHLPPATEVSVQPEREVCCWLLLSSTVIVCGAAPYQGILQHPHQQLFPISIPFPPSFSPVLSIWLPLVSRVPKKAAKEKLHNTAGKAQDGSLKGGEEMTRKSRCGTNFGSCPFSCQTARS